ncbi:MAG: serine/threonine protein kinase, partial [Aquisalimonadaceae bacterium]
MQETTEEVPYQGLGPDTVLSAVESTGAVCDGRLLALNSYENRVYQVGIEDQTPLVAKFYRPGRWSDEAILEEHAFGLELLGHDIPVVAPLVIGGRTLHSHEGFRFALYPRRGGRLPDLDMPDHRLWMGRFLGRMHAVGASSRFQHRPELSIQRFGREPLEYILSRDLVPGHVLDAYSSVAEDVLNRVEAAWQRAGSVTMIRL